MPTLLDTMQDESPKLRTRCAWALGEIQDLWAFDPILGLLEDPEPAVRIEGIRVLGKLGDPQAIQQLFDIWEALKGTFRAYGNLLELEKISRSGEGSPSTVRAQSTIIN